MYMQPFSTNSSYHGYMGRWPIQAATYYAATKARLAQYPALPYLRNFLSWSFTAALLLVSAFGFHQLWTMYSVGAVAPTSRPYTQPATSMPPAAAVPAGLPRSAPTTLSIPAIALVSDLVGVGQNGDGSLEVPPGDTVGWYTLAPTPGEIGPAILVGHVDSIAGPAIFAGLKELKSGDDIQITRQDGSQVHFAVTKTAAYEADNFPTQEVYGNIDHAGVRLITCYGTFNQLTRHYSHNLVVYAKAQ